MENDHPSDAESVRNAATHYRQALALFPQLTRADPKLLQNVRAARVGENITHLITQGQPALRELRIGAAIPQCDWKREFPSVPEPLLDKYMSLVQLGQLACLRARLVFDDGNNSAAFDDLAAVLFLARHISSDGLLMSRLIHVALEGIVVDIIAARLLKFDSTELRRIAGLVDSLPQVPSLAKSMRREQEFALNAERARFIGQSDDETRNLLKTWYVLGDKTTIRKATGETAEGVIRLIDEATAQYGELGDILMLPGEEYRQKWSAFLKRHSDNPASKQTAQSANGVRYASIRAENRLEMLRAATDCVAEGRREPRALRAFFESTPFRCASFPNGFELSCRFEYPGRPRINLFVGDCRGFRRWIRNALAMVRGGGAMR